jgi:cell division protein FtsZ
MIQFDIPKDQSSIIKVIGVGGGGSNAVNHMYDQGIDGVNFIICNTDAQAIQISKVPNKVQLGPNRTQGLGAGANPAVGREATEESLEEIKRILEVNTKMVFITAGMGGGTGTGGAPIVAKISRDLGILTVGIVTTPFSYEGKKRAQQAMDGINSLKDHVDTLLIINNDRLRHQFGNLKMSDAFAKADNILATAAKCITDVINTTGQINVDFADVCTVMQSGGVAILGNAAVGGENRALNAIQEAINSPLLNDSDINGAKWILVNINSSPGAHEHTMDEVDIIQNYIMDQAGEDTDVILGLGFDESLGDKISITLIATGFEAKNPFANSKEKALLAAKQQEKKIVTLNQEASQIQAAAMPQAAAAPVQEVPTHLMPTLHSMAQPAVSMPTTTAPAAEPERVVLDLNTAQPLQPSAEVAEENRTFLARPANIYQSGITVVPPPMEPTISANTIELSVDPRPMPTAAVPTQQPMPAPAPATPAAPQPADDAMDLYLVNRNITQSPTAANYGTPQADATDADALADRARRLRNLSFNSNSAEHDELENVPAFMRRKNEIQNLANVDKFYSNYTVGVDDNNNTTINPNTQNMFLDGQKPD